MNPVTEEELKASATAPRVTKEGLEANIAASYYFTGYEGIQGAEYVRRGKEKNGHSGINPLWFQSEEAEKERVAHPLSVLTFCVIVLKNGFTVTGQSACADPKNYNPDIGNRLAFEDAKNKIWMLMGYALKEEIYLSGGGTFKDRMVREQKELEGKLDKLTAFITTETYAKLPSVEKQLLLDQKSAMMDYADALGSRLSRLG